MPVLGHIFITTHWLHWIRVTGVAFRIPTWFPALGAKMCLYWGCCVIQQMKVDISTYVLVNVLGCGKCRSVVLGFCFSLNFWSSKVMWEGSMIFLRHTDVISIVLCELSAIFHDMWCYGWFLICFCILLWNQLH